MDKKNLILGVTFLVAAFAALLYSSRQQSQQRPPAPPSPAPMVSAPATAGDPLASAATAAPANTTFAPIASNKTEATITTLSNDYVEVRFTNFGGAIRDVALKKYPAAIGAAKPFVFNEEHADPILGFTDIAGLDKEARFELVSATADEVVFRAVFEKRLEVTRRYVLAPATGDKSSHDPYRILHETTVKNLADHTTPVTSLNLSLGTAALMGANDTGFYLNVASYNGDKAQFTDRNELKGGGFFASMGMGDPNPKAYIIQPGPVQWASVKNQFFASIYTPDDKLIEGVTVRRVSFAAPLPGTTTENIGLTASAKVELPAIAPQGTATFTGKLYVGPKEYTRLKNFTRSEDKVMQFDRYFFNRIFLSGVIAPFMNMMMNGIHAFVGNWGLAIVLMTLILKTVTLPFTLAASRSAKRMQKLQPMMKEINEKYKDNPTKKNQAVMALFKEHKVNPMGGCLPVLITIPLFVAFFAMLQGTAELRFQSFLWARDLSAPDTIARIPLGFMTLPINILPLLMGATMVFQMRLTPSPSVDNAQAKIFKMMPWIFTIICYNFSCALALYSTINGLYTIVQQLAVNRFTKDDDPASPAAAAKGNGPGSRPIGGKTIKNVTPSKKRF
ncbi:membrane protein insertase YidC [Opitutaceae bacterium TAV4]|nr:membrane protein insertase YidC [Opitutaceae bacterium TAV4]RRK02520.1 membrane protein insertase YidC [Opitutaceae bacterium TAV3]